MKNPFDITGRVAMITGGAGLLGVKHAEAIAFAGGIPVLIDIDGQSAAERAAALHQTFGVDASSDRADITKVADVRAVLGRVLARHGRVDILINNAANNPKMEPAAGAAWSRLENFDLAQWEADLAVGLTGAFLCARFLGARWLAVAPA